MNLSQTQVLSDDEGSVRSTQHLMPQKRVHQVAFLCIEKKKYPLFEGINTVGRHPNCDIVLTDCTVSKNHAEIEALSRTAFICDLGSSNKTYLNNDILRPQRFYQVDDGAKLRFGIVKAHYSFLRDIDNLIIFPIPLPVCGNVRRDFNSIDSENLYTSSKIENDNDSVIPATQMQNLNNEEDGEFTVPSSHIQTKKSGLQNRNFRVQLKETEISIHDIATQQYEKSDVHVDKNINEMETQQLDQNGNARTIVSEIAQDQSIISGDVKVGKPTHKIHNGPECLHSSILIHIDPSSNSIKNHIINETDDETDETDEEGEFTNIEPNNAENNSSNRNKISIMTTINPLNTRNCTMSPDFNERAYQQSLDIYNADESHVKQVETVNRDCEIDKVSAPAHNMHIIREENKSVKNHKTKFNEDVSTQLIKNLTIEQTLNSINETINSTDETQLIPSKVIHYKHETIESSKILPYNDGISVNNDNEDECMMLTQINDNNQTSFDIGFDDNTPTQVIDEKPKKEKIKNAKIKNTTTNDRVQNNKSHELEHLIKEPKKRVELQYNTKTSTPIINKKSVDINDSITKNLANLFGGDIEDCNFTEETSIATQQLQDILEVPNQSTNKIIAKLDSSKRSKSPNTSDTESQDEYCRVMYTKKKCNTILSSQDSTDSNGDNNHSITGFKRGRATYNKELVCETLKNEHRPTTEFQNNTNCEGAKILSMNADSIPEVDDGKGEIEEEDNDILAGLPEVRICGTAAYPASPSHSNSSLDDWEPFERKYKKKSSVSPIKKTLATSTSLSKVSQNPTPNVKTCAKKLPIQLSDTNKQSESSDNDDIDFEDLKKMAVGFIANDTQTKKLSIQLEKMPVQMNPKNDKIILRSSVSSEKKQAVPQRRLRGRPKKIMDSTLDLDDRKKCKLENNDSNIKYPQEEQSCLSETSMATLLLSSNHEDVSQKVETIREQSRASGPPRKRIRKVLRELGSSPDSITEQQVPSKNKKAKVCTPESPPTSNLSYVQHKVLFTGISHINYEKAIKKCGGAIVEKSDHATILVTDKIRRTNKFFCAIAKHIPIVTIKWIEDSVKFKHFVDWNEYILKDPVIEDKYKFDLRESLKRAAKKKLLDGYTFIITPNVKLPDIEEIKSMVQLSGGKTLVRAPKLWLSNTVIISCPDDVSKVQKLLSKAPKELNIPVFTIEFLLLGILQQELNFDLNRIKF